MGLLFTPKLKWTRAKLTLAAQAQKSIMLISNYQRKFGYFHHNDIFKLFDSMVIPILCYGGELWGFEYAQQIESFHGQFCKTFLSLPSHINNSMALGECGRLPLCTTYYVKPIKYWCHILQMSPNRYHRNIYIMLKQQDKNGQINWATNVKKMLFCYGFGFVWISIDVGDTDAFISQFKQRIMDCTSQNWFEDIATSGRCRLYKHFKTLLNIERYLTYNLPFYLRKALSNFRCSNHFLHIEMCRQIGIDRDLRFCPYCENLKKIEAIEDEIHAFFYCKLYFDLHQQYNPYAVPTRNREIEFSRLISIEDPKVLKNVAHFVFLLIKKQKAYSPQ